MKKSNSGFTILELMVGLGLSVIILLCVASAASGFFKTYNAVKDTSSIYPRLSSAVLWLYDENFNYEADAEQYNWDVDTSSDGTKFIRLTIAASNEGVLLDGMKSAEVEIVIPSPSANFVQDVLTIKAEFENPYSMTIHLAFPRPKNEE